MAQEAEQLALAGLAPRKRRKRAPKERHPAGRYPVAQVVLDVQAAHLGRTFDYLIDEKLDEDAQPGVMVRVRFGGQKLNGIIWSRTATSDAPASSLRYLERVLSGGVLVGDSMRRDIELIAQAYGGTLANIVRLAVPARVAKVDEEQRLALAIGRQSVTACVEQSPQDHETSSLSGAQHTGEALGARQAFGGAGTSPRLNEVLIDQELNRLQGCFDHTTALRDALGEHGFSPFVVDAMPGAGQWARDLAWMTARSLLSGRGAVLVMPSMREVNDMMQALSAYGLTAFRRTQAGHGGFTGDVACLSASMPQAERYRSYVAVANGQVRCVVGTRAAMYAPMEGEALFAIVEDSAYQYADGMMPYASARGVLRLRAKAHAGTLVVMAQARSPISQWESGETGIAPDAEQEYERSDMPRVEVADEGRDAGDKAEPKLQLPQVCETQISGRSVALHPLPAALKEATPWTRWFNRDELSRLADSTVGARVPHSAVRILSEALERGPVLFSIPQDGIAQALSCSHCHRQARCRKCTGPLRLVHGEAPRCGWCGAMASDWSCPACHQTRMRSVRVGAAGTAEELSQLFHGVSMVLSSPHQAQGVVARVPDRPLLVIATPGAEPRVESDRNHPDRPGSYQAVAILDAWTSLYAPGIDARQDALSAWMRAVAMCAPRAQGGQALILGESDPAIAMSLVLWDSRVLASREVKERAETGFPPVVSAATVWGKRDAVMRMLRDIGALGGDFSEVPVGGETFPSVLGPVPIAQPRTMDARELEATRDRVKAVVRVPLARRGELAQRLHTASARHVASREPGELRFQLDPKDLT